ncbi:Uncharacterised protein [Mycobacteroides abscessus]|nr:Uncharacterised protein [Mycobacteroides abscessus]
MTQSSSRSTSERSPVSRARSPRSHRSSTCLTTGVGATSCSTNSRTRCRYSPWRSIAVTVRPLASWTGCLPVMSWLISRIDRMGFSSARSRMGTPASTMRRMRSVEPTLSMVVVSAIEESPTMTCRRR